MSMNILPTGNYQNTHFKLELSYTDNNKVTIDRSHYENYEFISNKKYEYNEITVCRDEEIKAKEYYELTY